MVKFPWIKKPAFWDSSLQGPAAERPHFDFRRMWYRAVFLMLCAALLPFLTLAWFDYRISRQHIENEIVLRADRLLSNTKRTTSYFLDERQAALQFIAQDNSFAQLDDDRRLTRLLNGLSGTIGGFVDLGLFNAEGRQIRYIGPYALKDLDYSQEPWFQSVLVSGSYISDVYLGFREEPHMVIAVRRETEDGSFFVLRATLSTAWFNQQLAHVTEGGFGDSFLINHEGVIQTSSVFYGEVLKRFPLEVPPYEEDTRVLMTQDQWDRPIIMGYSYIPHSPFILLVIGQQEELLRPWLNTRYAVVSFLLVSGLLIMLVIPGVATKLVSDIYRADQERIVALREAAQANKLASLGRMAAGVAHEINNPLAIINEKAGLLWDLLAAQLEAGASREKILGLIDSIHRAVERCAGITRRLLSFARPGEMRIQPVNLAEVIGEVLEFHTKEAEFRDIKVRVEVAADLPILASDRGKLQQIFHNLVSNAFAAMADGGHLHVTATRRDQDHLLITVTDDGHGIAEEDLKRIFEPFYTTKAKKGGTGLGLSVTYGLVQELHGQIRVESAVGIGTRFFITIPWQSTEAVENQGKQDANIAG